jgi:hypothetical protein
MINIITKIQIVLFKIFIDFGTVFSEIKVLKSFNCLRSSLIEAVEGIIYKKYRKNHIS